MVWDKKQGPLNAHDWRVLGHEMYNGEDKAVLPARRLDVPMPHSVDGLHTLAHRFAGLSEAFHRLAREGQGITSPRLAIGDAQSQVFLLHQDFKRLRKEWETELRDLLNSDEQKPSVTGHLRPIG